MTLDLRNITPDDMAWDLGRALYEQLPTASGWAKDAWPWPELLDSDQLWHARRAQWYLDHMVLGPGQWPTPAQLVEAEILWDQTEYPGVLPKWEDYTVDQQRVLLEQASSALASIEGVYA